MRQTGDIVNNIAACQEIAVHMKYYFEAADKVTKYKMLRTKVARKLKVETEDADCDCLCNGSVMNEIGEFCEMDSYEFYFQKYSRNWCCYHRILHKVFHAIQRHSKEKRRRKLLVRGLLNASKNL